MPAKPRRPAPRGKSKRGGKRSLGPLILVGLLLFAGGVYFGGRLQSRGGSSVPPPTATAGKSSRGRTVARSASGTSAASTPAAGGERPLPPRGGKPARIALVIDDLGRSLDELAQ